MCALEAVNGPTGSWSWILTFLLGSFMDGGLASVSFFLAAIWRQGSIYSLLLSGILVLERWKGKNPRPKIPPKPRLRTFSIWNIQL